MAKGGKKGRNDVESSFVVIFAPPARKNSKRRKKEERERERREKEGKERGKGREKGGKRKGERGKSVSARRSFPRAERHN